MASMQDIKARAARNRAQIYTALQRRLVIKLAQDLALARRSPVRIIKERTQAKVARFFSSFDLPWSYKRKMRFARSANKRHPDRSEVEAGFRYACGSGSVCPTVAEYTHWIANKEPSLAPEPFPNRPLRDEGSILSFILSVDAKTNCVDLKSTVSALKQQSCADWDAIVVLGETPQEPVLTKLAELCSQDNRFTHCTQSEDVLTPTGKNVATLTPGDMLSPYVVEYLAQATLKTPTPKLIYGDDDQLDKSGQRMHPRFKSAWNRDLLYSTNYIGSFAAIEREMFHALLVKYPDIVHGLTHVILLQATVGMQDDTICHIPHILRHVPTERANDFHSNKDEVEAFLQQHENPGIVVLDGQQPEIYQPVWPVPVPAPKVCLIIPTRDQKSLVETAVTSILTHTDYDAFEILLVDNGSTDSEVLEWFDAITKQESNVRVLSYPHPFNYSAINNFAAQHTDAPLIGLLNNDVEAIHDDWLQELVSHAMRPDIGCVGAKLFFSDSSIQHAGVVLGIGPVAGHVFAHLPSVDPGYLHALETTRNVSAVTGACLMIRRELYLQVNGLNEENLVVACNDVDLCLKTRHAGFRSVWSPFAALFHHESASRGQDESPESKTRLKKEQEYMIRTWSLSPGQDAYFNPNLFDWL